MLRLAALDAVGLITVGFESTEGVLLSAVGDTVLSVFAVGVGVADAQAVRATRLMARTMLKMFFRFIRFLHR
jgi:class 3 adenylate cyclase